MTDSKFAGLAEFRCIGPFRGGRVVAVAGDPRDANTFYFGGVCGGVWKTTDAGQYWENISDGYFTASSVGALEVAPADPNVIYAGTGETTIRIDVSIGDGIYKSTDAGRSWKHLGMKETRQIAKIRSHPQNADLVYAAVFGHAFGPNPERGVYRSKDGGETWENVLHVSDQAGAIDLTIDKNNPRIIYASFWQAYRNFWQISSGGGDSGIWRSMDGGDTWQCLTGVKGLSNHPPDSSGGTRRVGLPKGMLGKIGLAASPAQPGRVWAIIENQPDGGIYRSDDYGETWVVGSKDNRFISRAWYYMHLTADPVDANTIYINNLNFWKSTDGGHNFTEITTPHGDDHDVWIHPSNNQIMIHGNDGGACVSLNGGLSWSSIYNQPTAQIYHLDFDSHEPYYVYGTQQDNSSLRVPSRSRYSSITWEDCDIIGSGESGYIAVDPDDPDIVYVGAIGSSPGGGNSLQRYDHRSQQIRLIATWPRSSTGLGAQADKYRFAWTYPIVFSPHDSNTIYIGGNQILKTTDEGQSWQEISPDLSKADPETLKPSGGPINRDAVGAEHYATVYTLAESPHEPGVIWAGSDDGLLHITRDGGENWRDITPPVDLPHPQPLPESSGRGAEEQPPSVATGGLRGVSPTTMFTMIEPSPHDPATAYVTATRYKNDDYAPYVYKTTDYGASWTTIIDGIAEDHFCRVLREDPQREGLLYLGTEFGLYVSFDAGDNWQRFQLNLPVSPIYDLKLKGRDLVVATHGRSFWILDDVGVLRQIDPRPKSLPQDEGGTFFTPSLLVGLLPPESGGTEGGTWAGGWGESTHLLKPGTVERHLPKVFEGLFDSGEGKQYMSTLGMVAAYVKEETPEHGVKHSYLDSGTNPPKGAVITYYLHEKPESTIKLRIDDADGNEVKTFKSLHADEEEKAKLPFPDASGKGPGDGVDKELRIPSNAGWNRFVWDLRYPDAHKVAPHDDNQQGYIKGPHAVPGSYRVTLTVGEEELSQPLEIVKEAGVAASQADLQGQFDLLLSIRDKVSATHKVVNQMRDVRAQLKGWRERLAGLESAAGIVEAAKSLEEQVLEVEKELMIPETRAGWPDAMNHGDRLAAQLSNLSFNVNLGDYKPTDYEHEAFTEIVSDIDGVADRFSDIVDGNLAEFNTMLSNAGFGVVALKVE